MTGWKINATDLVQCIIDGLPAYDPRNPSNRLEVVQEKGQIYFKIIGSVYYPDFEPHGFSNSIKAHPDRPFYTAHYIISDDLCVFKLSEIEVFEKEHGLLSTLEHVYLDPVQNKQAGALSGFDHSDDFRSVVKNGKTFTLTPMQAQVIQLLSEARGEGIGFVSQHHILENLDSKTKSLRDLFRKNLSAWEALIEPNPDRKGLFRLKI